MLRNILFLFSLLCYSVVVQAADSLVVYSGRSDKFVRPVMDAFTRETGVEVVLHNAKSTALLNKLRVEGSRTEADLFLSNDAGNLQTGSDLELFQPISVAVAGQVPAQFRAQDNSWVGLSARARVLVVNTESQDIDFIGSVFDLADPRLKGRVAITDSSNESFIAGVTVYMLGAGDAKVKAWLQGLKGNVDGKVFAKHSKIVSAVANGKQPVGLVNHYYIYRHLAKEPDAPIRILLPDQGDTGMGVAWNVAGVAISKHTRKQRLAEQLVAFLVSEKGQKMFAEANREYPVRPGVAAAPEVPPAGSYRVADVPMYQLGRHRNDTLNLLDEVGMP